MLVGLLQDGGEEEEGLGPGQACTQTHSLVWGRGHEGISALELALVQEVGGVEAVWVLEWGGVLV